MAPPTAGRRRSRRRLSDTWRVMREMPEVTVRANAVGGADHLGALTREHRRAFGKVYTPQSLARFVLDRAIPESEAIAGPVLDPACGAGVFLVEVVSRLAEEHGLGRHENPDSLSTVPSPPAEAATFVEAVRSAVWGMDVDPAAVELARKFVRNAVEQVVGLTLDPAAFDDTIVVGDFLADGLEPVPEMGSPWLVIGNPPYVAADRIGRGAKEKFKAEFETAFGRLDLYSLFVEQATRLVAPAGRLAFITPDKYLTSVSAGPLRDLLRRRGAVVSIGVFDSHKVFSEAATVPCITVWANSGAESASRTHFAFERLSLGSDPVRTPVVVDAQRLAYSRLASKSWTFQSRSLRTLDRRLQGDHPLLGETTKRISAGLTTGYNPAFVLDAAAASQLEPELVHPTVRGRDVLPYEIVDRRQFMLVPYLWDEEGRPHLIDLEDYPKARAWLRGHRSNLEQRHCVRAWNKKWWDLHDPVGVPLHNVPKVLVPDVARSNRFAADLGRFVPQHSAYYLTSDDLPVDVLAAILNSPAIELLVRTRAPVVKDGFRRYRRQFLIELPIPAVCDDTQVAIREASSMQRHDEVAELTCELFGVERGEIEKALETLSGPGGTGPRRT
jgi:adenine-specific DNA-methyltransferase